MKKSASNSNLKLVPPWYSLADKFGDKLIKRISSKLININLYTMHIVYHTI